MPIEFRCDHCNRLLRTTEDKAGLIAQCPGCGADLAVPQVTEPDIDELEIDLAADPRQPRHNKCPMCGTSVSDRAERCRNCGEQLVTDDEWVSTRPDVAKPHRGSGLLVFAILSWFFMCFGILFSIPVWVMADNDLKAMLAGQMDREGEGLTKAAKIISICHTLFFGFLMFLFCCLSGIGNFQ